MKDAIACSRCKGRGKVTDNWRALLILDVREITSTCSKCKGTGRRHEQENTDA